MGTRDFLFSNQTRESDGLAKEIAREIAFSRDRIILVSNEDLCYDVTNEKLRLLLLRDSKNTWISIQVRIIIYNNKINNSMIIHGNKSQVTELRGDANSE